MSDAGLVQFLYLVSSVLFIYGLKNLTRVRTARRGNAIAALAMLIAVIGTVIEIGFTDYRWILIGLIVGSMIGVFAALRVKMTEMPEMVALLNGFGGGASALVGISTLYVTLIEPGVRSTVAAHLGAASGVTLILSVLIGGVTFGGSVVAYLKLHELMRGNPILLPGRHLMNASLFLIALGLGAAFSFAVDDPGMIVLLCWATLAAALALGVLLVIPIGGADMPVVISLLNSYSGLAAVATGFVIGNAMLIIAGALVGASGLILTKIMCVAMNRSLQNVVFGGFGASAEAAAGSAEGYGTVRSGGAEEAAMLLESAERVMIVPGYGLAVAQAQHVVREIADLLEKRGAKVVYAIHPVAGRMPGHMNVLLAEADVPYEKLLELEAANAELRNVDVAIVVGANDVVNPAAEKDPSSPVYGMPIIQVHNARSIIVIKRSLGAGFAGVRNELFEHPKTMMVFLDAKKALQEIVTELKTAAAA
ncbi:MAG TPA: NAD(P)(+) transhydrogenase (Re/Si-specific) subunit beta [Thermoanaerobaculia bacterium]|nr:NAD(P)(+) transhydrogenase (Re/Si-specific) subunit beta [Thermoanaerobaculia bacterium]